jgi:hypothetical protein
MSKIIEWLESPEGERWSEFRHHWNSDNSVFRQFLVVVKDDYTAEGLESDYEAIIWAA